MCLAPVPILWAGMPPRRARGRGEVGEFKGKRAMEARKSSETLGDLLVGVGRGEPTPKSGVSL